MQGIVEFHDELLYDVFKKNWEEKNMNPVNVRNIRIGEGIPKICVPIVGKTAEEILTEAKRLSDVPKDLIEWRSDWFQDVFEPEKVNGVLETLRNIFGETPILFTFRTAREGGEKEVSVEAYKELNQKAIESGFVDILDVEIFGDSVAVEYLINHAHENAVKVIGSNHDFEKTPSEQEIVARLCKMQDLGADILKIAVMPKSKKDVITLLAATETMVSEHANQPVVTMSMSKDGMISRIAGEIFGSSITFGSAAKASAPGQVPVDELKETLEMIHHLLENK